MPIQVRIMPCLEPSPGLEVYCKCQVALGSGLGFKSSGFVAWARMPKIVNLSASDTTYRLPFEALTHFEAHRSLRLFFHLDMAIAS